MRGPPPRPVLLRPGSADTLTAALRRVYSGHVARGPHLGLQVVGVLVVEPDLGVVAVAEAVAGDPGLLVAATLRHDPRHLRGRAQVQLQPLVL